MSFVTSREIAAPPEAVFAAFADSDRLAAWWGPAGFRNTFHHCHFSPGGSWSFVMHGPDGKDYDNESVFQVIEEARRVVIEHQSLPQYLLTITLEPTVNGTTRVRWEQAFAKPEVARGIEHIVVPANEQNLDRLTAEVLRLAGDGD